jgi:hypothetical protein
MTLRPLFREVLHLGGDTSNKQSHGTSNAYAFGSRLQRRTNGYELTGESRDHVSSSNQYNNSMTLTEILGGQQRKEEDSSSFDTESQKKILVGDGEAPTGGIVVTRDVKLLHNTGRN